MMMMMMIYDDGTLEALHSLICSGFISIFLFFLTWKITGALLPWRQMCHRTSAPSLGCYKHAENNQRS